VGTGATLSANGVEGQWTVSTGTNNPVLATGDIVYISDSTTDNAELNRVVSVAGTNPYVVTLHASLINDYATASTAQIRKLNAVINTSIENIRLWGNGTTNGGVWYEYAYDCDVRTAWFTGIYGTALLYFNSAHMTVNDYDMRDGTDNTNNSYGMNVASSSHHGLFTNNYSENLREHAFGTGAKHHVFAHNTMRNHYDDGVNTHGNGASRVTFASNLVSGVQAGHGIVVGQSVGTAADSYVSVIGNIVEECNQSGIYVAGGTSAITHHVLVADNIVRRNGRQANGANPQINVYAGATAAFLTDIEVRDNIVSGIASVDTGRLIYVSGGTNVRIAGNHCDTAFNEYGIQQDGASTNNSITDNLIRNVDSNNIRTVATNTGMLVARNRSDDTDFTRAAGEMWRDNIWGTTQSRNFGSAAITTGSTIAHGLVTTPTAWGATFIITGMSNLFITADATNLTVNWTGGGTQTVKWWAEV
jgi:hypothetical protein